MSGVRAELRDLFDDGGPQAGPLISKKTASQRGDFAHFYEQLRIEDPVINPEITRNDPEITRLYNELEREHAVSGHSQKFNALDQQYTARLIVILLDKYSDYQKTHNSIIRRRFADPAKRKEAANIEKLLLDKGFLRKRKDGKIEENEGSYARLQKTYPFEVGYQRLRQTLSRIKKTDFNSKSLFDSIENRIAMAPSLNQKGKLLILEQLSLDGYYKRRGQQKFLSSSRVANAFEKFLVTPPTIPPYGLGLNGKYPPQKRKTLALNPGGKKHKIVSHQKKKTLPTLPRFEDLMEQINLIAEENKKHTKHERQTQRVSSLNQKVSSLKSSGIFKTGSQGAKKTKSLKSKPKTREHTEVQVQEHPAHLEIDDAGLQNEPTMDQLYKDIRDQLIHLSRELDNYKERTRGTYADLGDSDSADDLAGAYIENPNPTSSTWHSTEKKNLAFLANKWGEKSEVEPLTEPRFYESLDRLIERTRDTLDIVARKIGVDDKIYSNLDQAQGFVDSYYKEGPVALNKEEARNRTKKVKKADPFILLYNRLPQKLTENFVEFPSLLASFHQLQTKTTSDEAFNMSANHAICLKLHLLNLYEANEYEGKDAKELNQDEKKIRKILQDVGLLYGPSAPKLQGVDLNGAIISKAYEKLQAEYPFLFALTQFQQKLIEKKLFRNYGHAYSLNTIKHDPDQENLQNGIRDLVAFEQLLIDNYYAVSKDPALGIDKTDERYEEARKQGLALKTMLREFLTSPSPNGLDLEKKYHLSIPEMVTENMSAPEMETENMSAPELKPKRIALIDMDSDTLKLLDNTLNMKLIEELKQYDEVILMTQNTNAAPRRLALLRKLGLKSVHLSLPKDLDSKPPVETSATHPTQGDTASDKFTKSEHIQKLSEKLSSKNKNRLIEVNVFADNLKNMSEFSKNLNTSDPHCLASHHFYFVKKKKFDIATDWEEVTQKGKGGKWRRAQGPVDARQRRLMSTGSHHH